MGAMYVSLELIMGIHKIIAITTTLLATCALASGVVASRKRPLSFSSSSSTLQRPSSSTQDSAKSSGEKWKSEPAIKKSAAAFSTPDGETAGQSGQKDFLRDEEISMLCEQQTTAGELCEWIGYLDGMVRDNLELFDRNDIRKVRTRLNKFLAFLSSAGENKENDNLVNYENVIGHLRAAVEALHQLKSTSSRSNNPLGQIHRVVLGLALLIDHSLGESTPHDICLTAHKSLLHTSYPLWTQQKEKAVVDGLKPPNDVLFCAGPIMVLKLLASFDEQKPGFSAHRDLLTSVLNKLITISKNPKKISQASDVRLIKAVMAQPFGLKNTLTIVDSLLGDAINQVRMPSVTPPVLNGMMRSSSKTSLRGKITSSASETSLGGRSSSSEKTSVSSKTAKPPAKPSLSGKAESSSSKTSVNGNTRTRPSEKFSGERYLGIDDIHLEDDLFSNANPGQTIIPKGGAKFTDALFLKEPMYPGKKREERS